MNKNSLIISIIFTLLIIGVVVANAASLNGKIVGNTSGVVANIASITAEEKLYDFGTISMANGNVSHVFKVINSTNQDVKVAKLVTSCMCTAAYILRTDGSKNGPFKIPGMGFVPPANEIIKAGETMEVEVVYDPNAHGPAGVGSINRFLILTEEGGGELGLEIRARVTP